MVVKCVIEKKKKKKFFVLDSRNTFMEIQKKEKKNLTTTKTLNLRYSLFTPIINHDIYIRHS